jgi:imidazolonepropionase-like amidohydrolase
MRLKGDWSIRGLLWIAVLGMHAALAASPSPQTKTEAVAPAELLFKSGAVYTVDGSRSWAQAVGVSAGHIVYVGSDQGAGAYIGPATRVIDLKGRMVLPAFQDVHIHPISAGL